MKDFPHRRSAPELDVEATLAQYSYVEAVGALDEKALAQLREADPARAIEILEDLVAKTDVRNPSAFVSMALKKFPHKRTGGTSEMRPVAMTRVAFPQLVAAPRYPHRRGDPVDIALMHAPPSIRNGLYGDAMRMLREADVGRAVEIIQDIIAKGDVRNPSAFIMKAVGRFPHQRGSVVQDVDSTLSRHPALSRLLDDVAIQQLRSADLGRALEIIEDMAAKSDLRNPSAFVAIALRNFPHKRGSLNASFAGGGGQQYVHMPSARMTPPRFAMTAVDQALARCPRIARALDEEAVQRLRTAEPARAVEIIEDAAAKPDIRNPSAFVSKALMEHPHKRGRENAGLVDAGSNAKRQRTGSYGREDATLNANQREYGSNSAILDSLDEKAQNSLRNADPDRAREILDEMESMGSAVRNPNAFVTKAVSQYPKARGRSHAF